LLQNITTKKIKLSKKVVDNLFYLQFNLTIIH